MELEATGEAFGLGIRGDVGVSPATALVAETPATLVDAVRRGDRDAFERLYKMFSPLVHGVLLARVPAGEVDDLVQDVFLTAYRRLESLRESAAFGGWVAMIARNRATDYFRSRQETEDLTDDIPQHSSTEEGAEAARALAAIRDLPEAYRETLVFRLVE